MKQLVSINDLSLDDILSILDRADGFSKGMPTPKSLAGKTIFLLFFENSTRTRVSFELAAHRLGANVITVSTDGSSVKKGESLDDTLKTLAAMKPDGVIIRHAQNGSAELAATVFSAPVVNAGDGTNEHPTQALLDALAIRQSFGRIKGLSVAICGDILHSRVAQSNALLLEKLGASVRLCGTTGSQPAVLEDAITGADVVMMLRVQKERLQEKMSLSEDDYFKRFGLTQEKLKLAAPYAKVMHPGPLNRGVEIADDVADDPVRSLILKQVELGVHIRISVLEKLMSA